MAGYREFRFYSSELDAEAVRFSIANEDGQEYFAIVPVVAPGKRRREWRDQVLDRIDEAMMAGDPPGEVTWQGK